MASAEIQEALKSGVLPAAIAAVGAFLVRRTPSRWRAGLAVLVVVAAYGSSHWWIAGRPDFPPADVTHWLPYLLLVAWIPALASKDSRPLALLLWLAMTGAVVWTLLSGRSHAWEQPATSLWFAGTGAGLMLLWSPHMNGGLREDGVHWVVGLTLAGTAVAAYLGFSAKFFQLGTALAVAVGVGALANLKWKDPALSRGFAVAGSVGLGALLILNYHFGKVTWEVALGLCAAWLSLQLHRVGFLRGAPAGRAILGRTLVAAAILGGVLWWAYRVHQEKIASDPYFGF